MIEPLVSVVIPTYNSEKTLKQCLESIINQSYSNIEIIVVDKKSKDNTIKIARKYTNKIFTINARERSEQKNLGARRSRGKYLYFVDSDFILEPTVVEEAVKKCEKENYDAICIHNSSDPNISFWSKVRKLERDCYMYDKINVAARFIKKSVFFIVGGFDEELVAGEDYDLHNRLIINGFKIGYINAKEIHIGEPENLMEIIRKYYYYGKTIPKFLKKNKKRGLKQLSPIRLAYIKKWRRFLRHPILTIGFVIYQLVRYMAALLGFIIGKLNEEMI